MRPCVRKRGERLIAWGLGPDGQCVRYASGASGNESGKAVPPPKTHALSIPNRIPAGEAANAVAGSLGGFSIWFRPTCPTNPTNPVTATGGSGCIVGLIAGLRHRPDERAAIRVAPQPGAAYRALAPPASGPQEENGHTGLASFSRCCDPSALIPSLQAPRRAAIGYNACAAGLGSGTR